MNIMSNIPNFNTHAPVFDQERLNSMDPLENQMCRVCNEQAAGFHFGAFTCEGCKSFFGRSCNNQTVIQECRNNYQCVIDKKNRTSCKACRLRKCLLVGMSKSGCRYGRRSNWFKIHCLMQKNAPKMPSVTPSPYTRPSLHIPESNVPSLVQISPSAQMSPITQSKPFMSSRSPSPLNTSTETNSIHSCPSPSQQNEPAVSPPPSLMSPPMLFDKSSPSTPVFDVASLYRLNPLFAVNPLLLASHPLLKMDFKQQLDLLAERRAMFEKFKSEIESKDPVITPDSPIDLSCK